MKIVTISDVHCEFHKDDGKAFCENLDNNCDILLVAGDFATYHSLVRNLTILCQRFPKVLFVCGNHELYGTARGEINNKLLKLEKRFSHFHHLNKSTVTVDGLKFAGATLWFPNHPMNPFFIKQMNDIKMIRGFKKWNYQENEKCVQFFNKEVEEGCIVISHHAPCWNSISGRWIHEKDLNRFYVTDMSELILAKKPKLWVHGHIHENADYLLGSTRVFANPHGYTTELRSSRWKPIVLEV